MINARRDEKLMARDNLPIDCVTFDTDEGGLTPELERHYAESGEETPEIVLQASSWRAGEYVSGLGGISFYASDDDHVWGCFYHVSEIPERCSHLREIARQLELPE